jgi:small-conductance mechanosensitive channel/CRP-like cAMP-binding protein
VPLVLVLLLFGTYFSRQMWGEPGKLRDTFFGADLQYVLFGAVAALIVLAVRIFDAIAFDFVFARRKHIVAPLLLREILSLALYAVLLSMAVSWIFGYSVRGLLATTTVVAAVVGLAMQDTLGNLFSGISLHLERTFEVGDVVKSGDHIGVVEGVNWRAARIRTFNDNIVVLPNSALSRERIEVFPKGKPNARIIEVGIAYEAEPARVIEVLDRAVRVVPRVATEPAAYARVGSFADSAVTYQVKYWTREYEQCEVIDAEVRRVIWYALKRNGLVIPFPIRTLHISREKNSAAKDSSEILGRLQMVDLLAPLTEAEHEQLAGVTRVLAFSLGEPILRQGEQGDSMFVVHRGAVSVRITAGSEKREVAVLGEGSIFGEMALLTGESRSADVVAASGDVEVLEIDKEAMQPILEADPQLAGRLSEKIIERRSSLASASKASAEDQRSILGRIRSWFSLGS